MSLAPGAPAWRASVPSAESAAAEDVARRIARIASIANALLLSLGIVAGLPEISHAPDWWRATSVVLALASAGILVSHRASRAVVRVSWALYPPLWALASVSWTVFGAPAVPDQGVIPWSWVLAPLAISIAALRWNLVPAVVVGATPVLAVLGVAIAGSGLTPGIASTSALHLGDLFFAVVIMAARGHLFETWRSARELAEEEHAARLEFAWRAERDRLTAIVHDHVLGTLGTAGGGLMSVDLSAAARRSVVLLTDAPDGTGDATAVLQAELRALALANGFEFAFEGPDEELRFPIEAGDAVLAAVAQAARNSVEHAGRTGGSVARTMRVQLGPGWVEVDVADDGDGFEPSQVPLTRLGLRTSVLGRMRTLGGGGASVESAPGQGTRVRISWRATEHELTPVPVHAPDPAAHDLPDIGTVAGATGTPGRVILLSCWALGLVWLTLSWPGLPLPGLVLVGAGWLLAALLLATRPSAELPNLASVVMALTPAIAAGCLLPQWTQVRSDEVWLLQLAADVGGLLALRGRARAALLGSVLTAAVVLPLTWRMGQPGAGIGLMVIPVTTVVAGIMLHRGFRRTMQANLDFRTAEAQARASQQAARDAAERAGRLRAEVVRMGLPSLHALAAGAPVDDTLAEACQMAAAAIRDILRAPSLATGSLARACADARRRGVQVRLFDDSSGMLPLREQTIRQLTDGLDSAMGGRVTIRMLPAGRSTAVTAVLDDDTVRRMEFAE